MNTKVVIQCSDNKHTFHWHRGMYSYQGILTFSVKGVMELLLILTLKAQKHAIEMLYGGIQRFALDGLWGLVIYLSLWKGVKRRTL